MLITVGSIVNGAQLVVETPVVVSISAKGSGWRLILIIIIVSQVPVCIVSENVPKDK